MVVVLADMNIGEAILLLDFLNKVILDIFAVKMFVHMMQNFALYNIEL